MVRWVRRAEVHSVSLVMARQAVASGNLFSRRIWVATGLCPGAPSAFYKFASYLLWVYLFLCTLCHF